MALVVGVQEVVVARAMEATALLAVVVVAGARMPLGAAMAAGLEVMAWMLKLVV